jgi:hypothetical protein
MFAYGFLVQKTGIFPNPYLDSFLKEAGQGLRGVLSAAGVLESGSEGYVELEEVRKIPVYDHDKDALTLLTGVDKDRGQFAKVVGGDGSVIHQWDIDWFKIWADTPLTHTPKDKHPRSRPGAGIHGALLLDNGDLVFNFDFLGTVRLDVCGHVVWKLPYSTHHSIYRDENKVLWIPATRWHYKTLPGFPEHRPPIGEAMILKVSEEGELLEEISVLDLLNENGLQGLLYMSDTKVKGDALYLNDVEIFPGSMKEGALKAGDIMVSLRDINTVLIFDGEDRKIKHKIVGEFVRQHDPDFIDGDTISVFDNKHLVPRTGRRNVPGEEIYTSRVLTRPLEGSGSHVSYSGPKDRPFYTDEQGKHQRLGNGNILITESGRGRAFEVDPEGRIVWQYVNRAGKRHAGLLTEAQRLPDKYDREFFEKMVQKCRR